MTVIRPRINADSARTLSVFFSERFSTLFFITYRRPLVEPLDSFTGPFEALHKSLCIAVQLRLFHIRNIPNQSGVSRNASNFPPSFKTKNVSWDAIPLGLSYDRIDPRSCHNKAAPDLEHICLLDLSNTVGSYLLTNHVQASRKAWCTSINSIGYYRNGWLCPTDSRYDYSWQFLVLRKNWHSRLVIGVGSAHIRAVTLRKEVSLLI